MCVPTAIPGIAPATDDIHRATHVVLRHKQLAAYRSARCLRKKMVSIFWAAELAKQGQLMPLDDPVSCLGGRSVNPEGFVRFWEEIWRLLPLAVMLLGACAASRRSSQASAMPCMLCIPLRA